MKRALIIIAVAGTSGCASAAVPGALPQPSRDAGPERTARAVSLYSRIPTEIGAFKLTERTVVREVPYDSLFRFRDGSRTNLSVIIYDIPTNVKVGTDSQHWTVREGEKFRIIQEVRASRGRIADYVVAFSDTSRFATEEGAIVEHRIATPVRYPNGTIAVDMQYVYLIGGKFVKVRATIPEPGWQQTKAPSFARELALRLAGGT